jgi:hypothetical protein
MRKISGSCLCGETRFECGDRFSQFHWCHCSQCRKASGTAHAANLFTDPDNINWLKGQANSRRYDVPGRTITSAFCLYCGSPMPYLSKSGKALVVPAGSLDDEPSIAPSDNIFWAERAGWYETGIAAEKFDGFPS